MEQKIYLSPEVKIRIRKYLRELEYYGYAYSKYDVELYVDKIEEEIYGPRIYHICFGKIFQEKPIPRPNDRFELVFDTVRYGSITNLVDPDFTTRHYRLMDLGIFDYPVFLTTESRKMFEHDIWNAFKETGIVETDLFISGKISFSFSEGMILMFSNYGPTHSKIIYDLKFLPILEEDKEFQDILVKDEMYLMNELGLFDPRLKEYHEVRVSPICKELLFTGTYVQAQEIREKGNEYWFMGNPYLPYKWQLEGRNDNMITGGLQYTPSLGLHEIGFRYDKETLLSGKAMKEMSTAISRDCTKLENKAGTMFDSVKKIISADPKTIVLFMDGSKEIATCSSNDIYDLQYGIMICLMKHNYNGSQTEFNKQLDRMVELTVMQPKKRNLVTKKKKGTKQHVDKKKSI